MPPSNREGWIDWRWSIARQIILDDLNNEILPLDESELSAFEAWDLHYSHLVEFRDVVFSQFEARLADHRAQIKHKGNHITRQMQALNLDRSLHPERTHNRKGELVFYTSRAFPKLIQDVAGELHLTMTWPQLWHSRPEYYEDWKYEVFQGRVRQEIARQKFVYHCEVKRAEKAAKARKKREQNAHLRGAGGRGSG